MFNRCTFDTLNRIYCVVLYTHTRLIRLHYYIYKEGVTDHHYKKININSFDKE